MRRFIQRKNIKFCKGKCGKEKTSEESIPDFLEFMENLRFNCLQPREDDGNDGRDPLGGGVPPVSRPDKPNEHVPLHSDCESMDDNDSDDGFYMYGDCSLKLNLYTKDMHCQKWKKLRMRCPSILVFIRSI